MLAKEQTGVVIIDIQERLIGAMAEPEFVVEQVGRLIDGAKAMGLPIIVTEQIPEKLGPTVPELAERLSDIEAISKNTFGCCGSPAFLEAVAASGRKQWLVCGIETQVCVAQTVMGLLDDGYEVQLVADAVSSRTLRNRDIAIERMRDEGAIMTSVEMALFELQHIAEGDTFKQLLKIVK